MVSQEIETLVEREPALDAMGDVIAAAGRRDGSVVVIEAAAGLGKTALLSAASRHAAGAGMDVAAAVGAEMERDLPFGIARQLFERQVVGAGRARHKELLMGSARLAAPVLGVDRGAPGAGERQTGQQAAEVMHGLYWLVVNLAERAPLMITVDDAHWADSASLRWLRYLVRRLEGLPVVVALSARPREPGADQVALETITAEPSTRVVRLSPLTSRGTARLVDRALGGEADEGFCEACHAASGGNPYLLRALTEVLAQEGMEPTAASVPRVRELVPESVTRSVVMRIGRLPETARRLARAAAVLGPGTELRDAAALAGLDAGAAAHAADALAAAGILAPGLPLRYVHPLLHAAVLRDVPAAERALAHAQAARVVASGGAGADRIAAHLLRAGPAGDPWAVAQLRQAAAAATARGDPHCAIAFLRRAFVEPVPDEVRIPLLRELLHTEFVTMDPSATEGLDADPDAEITADPDALQQSALHVVLRLYYRGSRQDALAVLERAVEGAAAAGDHERALGLEVRWIAFAQLAPPEALRRLRSYAGSVEPGTAAARLMDASLAWYGSFSGHSASQTLERARRGFADGRLVAELEGDDLVLGSLAQGLILTDDMPLATRVTEQILEQARARGSASAVAGGSYLSAYLAYRRGDLMRAEGEVQAAVWAFTEAGIIGALPPMTTLLVDTLAERGRLHDAATALTAAGMGGEVPDHWWFAPVLWSRGKLRLAQGRTQEGLEDLLEFGRRGERDDLGGSLGHAWASLAAPCLHQLGKEAEARRIAQDEFDQAQAWGTPRAVGQALRALGLITPGADGCRLLLAAVETLETSPARLEHARALIDLGAALRRRNQRVAAREPLRVGLDIASRCGAGLLVERGTHELRATGAKPRKLTLAGVEALTASERRIAEMAAEGQTNRQIAQALFVTIKTVETHMAHVFQKLDVRSRHEVQPCLAAAAD